MPCYFRKLLKPLCNMQLFICDLFLKSTKDKVQKSESIQRRTNALLVLLFRWDLLPNNNSSLILHRSLCNRANTYSIYQNTSISRVASSCSLEQYVYRKLKNITHPLTCIKIIKSLTTKQQVCCKNIFMMNSIM